MTAVSVILLHPDDNIVVAAGQIRAGDTLIIDGAPVLAPNDVGIGHKLARRALNAGDKISKYGAPIGSMTGDAPRGAHVHLHNMKSDYIATHMRDTVGGQEGHQS